MNRHAIHHALAEGPRRLGLMLAALGLIAAVLRGTAAPWLPKLVPVVLIVTALGLIGVGIVRRARYQFANNKEPRP